MREQKWSFVPCPGETNSYIEDANGDGEILALCLDESSGPLMAEAPALLDACKGLASLAYSLMSPAKLPPCYRDAVAIFDRLERLRDEERFDVSEFGVADDELERADERANELHDELRAEEQFRQDSEIRRAEQDYLNPRD